MFKHCRMLFTYCFTQGVYTTDPKKSWKVVEIKIRIFQAWKVM